MALLFRQAQGAIPYLYGSGRQVTESASVAWPSDRRTDSKTRSSDRFAKMSLDFKFSFVPGGASLDDRSRRVMRGFALQLCVSSFLVLGPCIFGMRPWDGAAQL